MFHLALWGAPTAMLTSQSRLWNLPTLLLSGALVLSFGLNVLLLKMQAVTWPEDDNSELTATTAELHLTQRLLTQCQGRQQQQDSLLVLLRAYPTAAAPAVPSPASYSTQ